MKRHFLLLMVLLVLTPAAMAQNRNSPSQAKAPVSVTGTYRYISNEFKIVELPGQKVKISFSGSYPNVRLSERRKYPEGSANMGTFNETVPLKGRTAIVKLQYLDEPCIITIKFRSKGLEAEQNGASNQCGFGFNVEVDGVYRKISSETPYVD